MIARKKNYRHFINYYINKKCIYSQRISVLYYDKFKSSRPVSFDSFVLCFQTNLHSFSLIVLIILIPQITAKK